MNNDIFKLNRNVFNTPLEVGLRVLNMLNELKSVPIDINRLIIYDYFVLHANDFNENYESLHPAIPHRTGEIIIKRKIIQEGIQLMYAKDLIDIKYTENGIYYSANELTSAFLNYFDSTYETELIKNAQIVINEFKYYSEQKLSEYVNDNLSNWGSEFSRESLIRTWLDEY